MLIKRKLLKPLKALNNKKEMDYGSLKSFLTILNLKKLFPVSIMLIMKDMIEFVFYVW